MVTFQESFGNLPDFAPGSVFGIRQFTVLKDSGRLGLKGRYGQSWPGTYMEATCGKGLDHQAPDEACKCGIYAYWTVPSPRVLGAVYAVVEGYGKTILGTKGFKSEKVRIVGLCVFGYFREDNTPDRLKERYPVPFYSSIEDLIESHPLTLDYYDPTVETDDDVAQARLVAVNARLDKAVDELQAIIDRMRGSLGE